MSNVEITQHTERSVKSRGHSGEMILIRTKLIRRCRKGWTSLLVHYGARDPNFIRNIDWVINFTKQRIIDEFSPRGW